MTVTPTNANRAGRAYSALLSHSTALSPYSRTEMAIDLVTDLYHLLGAESMTRVLRSAANHYEEECAPGADES